MADKLTKKEKVFADNYLESGNGTQSALKAYDTTSERVAASIAYENLRKPDIRQYLEDNASSAASRIVDLSISAENETVRLNANKDILDRAGYKPVEKTQTLSLELKGNISDPAMDLLRERYEEELKTKLLS